MSETNLSMTCETCGRKLESIYTGIKWIPKHCSYCAEMNRKEELKNGLENLKAYMREKSGMQRGRITNTFKTYHIDFASEREKRCVNDCIKFVDEKGINGKIGVVLLGTCGRGKTHLLYAMANRYIDNDIDFDERDIRYFADFGKFRSIKPHCMLIVCDELLRRAEEWRKRNRYGDEKLVCDITTECKNVRFLLIDDLGAKEMTEWERSIVCDIIDYRTNNGKMFALSTNYTQSEIQNKLGQRLYDRIKGACATPYIFTGESYRGKEKS